MLLHLDIKLVGFEVAVVELAARHPRTLPRVLKTLCVVVRVEVKRYGVRHGPRGSGSTSVNAEQRGGHWGMLEEREGKWLELGFGN